MADNRITQIESILATRIATADGSVILYDGSRLDHADARLFDAAHWPGAVAATSGRGATWFIDWRRPGQPSQSWVLRHYRRGGIVGRFVRDRYLWLGESRTRAFREWHLLRWACAAGLPCPQPVAARVQRSGPSYTADLITARLPGVTSLSDRIRQAALRPADWGRIGACIRRFHDAGVWHADLNAHNVQLADGEQVYLLDFDRGERRDLQRGWQQSNLERLHRSLEKISQRGAAHFDAGSWAALLDGYARGGSA
jgi:3-deoxy-D-manno-octulosonic acid kinase